MRVVLAPDGTRGDVFPLLALGERFRRLRHSVLVCAPPNFRAETESRGLEFTPVGEDTQAFIARCADSITAGGFQVVREFRAFTHAALADQLRRVPEASRGADLIVGAGVQAGARVASALNRIPYRYVVYCPALIPSPDLTPLILPTRPLPRWVNRPAWRLAAGLFNQIVRTLLNERLEEGGVAPVKSAMEFVLGDRPVLAADAELAPAGAESRFEIQQIPCLHPFEGPPLPAKLESFLDAGPPPVYLGFGSMTDPDPAGTTRALLAAVSAAGIRAVISRGWAGLGEGPLPEGVFAADAVSHAHLFPRMAAVVHHGGAGTTTTAARAGVPQLVMPHVLDQHYWAARVTALGLGPPRLLRNRLTAPRLAELLRSMCDNEVLQERAQEVGMRLREHAAAAPDPAEVLLRG